jgi:hypothetical protein
VSTIARPAISTVRRVRRAVDEDLHRQHFLGAVLLERIDRGPRATCRCALDELAQLGTILLSPPIESIGDRS